jgi:hypothetical protein
MEQDTAEAQSGSAEKCLSPFIEAKYSLSFSQEFAVKPVLTQMNASKLS